MTTLISLLGKGQDPKTGYREATYQFADNSQYKEAFFGVALAKHIKPKRLLLAGTAGSMWDVFLEQQKVEDEALLELMQAVQNATVSQVMLNAHEKHLTEKLGVPVTCVLIPYAQTEAEQVTILQTLADTLSEQEQVVLGVTHGFRHLPMLALVAARYLARVRKVKVQALYYGAFEMTEGDITPVLSLTSLLRMLDWVEALAIYEHSGDYGLFAPLLKHDGLESQQASLLQEAAFYERTSNPVKAREKLSNLFTTIEQHQGPLGRLFSSTLSKRLNWFRRHTRAEWEQSLGEAYLERQDFLRAAIYLHEANVSAAAASMGLDINDFDCRKNAFEQQKNDHSKQLNWLRNSLAHGLRSRDSQSQKALKSSQSLRDKMMDLKRKLFASS